MTIKAENEAPELADNIEVLSPGQILQEARLKAGLSQDQIANTLKLRIQVIQDVEADSYSDSLSVTFIKGYLKAYAKLVGVGEQVILDSYSHQSDARVQQTELQSFSRRLSHETNDSRLMQFTYLLLFGLVVALVVWWWQQDTQLQQAEQETRAQESTLSQEPQPIAALSPIIESEPSLSAAEGENLDATLEAPVVTAAASEMSESEPVVALAMSDDDAADTSIRLKFTRDCWVEIKDATGERLAVGTKKAGYEMTLSGQAPYNVVLGTAKGVEINYQQKVIDLSAHMNGKVAHITVPAN